MNNVEDIREKRAIDCFTRIFYGSYQKLDSNDIDYKIYDQDGTLIAYAEVAIRYKSMYDAYPLPVNARKFVKLIDKRLNPVVIWACEDGIIYAKAKSLSGSVLYNKDDDEFFMYFDKNKSVKYIRYER
jgi:hypothetical protein